LLALASARAGQILILEIVIAGRVPDYHRAT
jgi:hypothetical protein